MQFKATQKFVRVTPRKVRLVANAIRTMKPAEAVEVLPHVNKSASLPLLKVIKTAIANAKQKGFSNADLVFKEIQIGEGPRLKRGLPVSRGRWHPIIKRMSHIRVVVEGSLPEPAKKEKKAEKSSTDEKKKVSRSKLKELAGKKRKPVAKKKGAKETK